MSHEKIIVYLARIPQYEDYARRYKVFLDGAPVGEIKKDETLKLSVNPGEHRIHFAMDYCRSNTIIFNARVGQDVYLECGNNTKGKALLTAVFARDAYLYVKRVH